MTTAELAQQIILWIRRTHKETEGEGSETEMQDRYFALVDDIETLCKDHLGKEPSSVSELPVFIPGLTEARCVHYVAYNGRCLAALVIGHEPGGKADLAVFTNMANVNGVKNFGTQFHQDIEYSEVSRPGTWHWIEKA